MLVLTRKINERIMIDDNVTIKVIKIVKGQVSLGIEAPLHLEVYREEIYRKIQKEKLNDSEL